ncbi:MAG: Bro-N domain-containing protein [Anaerovoracaceae bacterium]
MKNLTVFKNEQFGEVRVIDQNGEPWFVGKDVAEILGYANTPKAIRDHVDDEDKLTERIVLSGQNREAVIINESGLYSLILSSKLPQAKQFKRWVTSEVLPSIRKTGSYATPKSKDERLHVMEMNARSRMAQTYLKLANVDTLSDTYKTVLVSKASEVLAGEPILPLPVSKHDKVYSAKEIGEILGISANKVGRIANEHNLKIPEYGEYRRDKSRYSAKEVDTWVYFETAIAEFSKILGIEVA